MLKGCGLFEFECWRLSVPSMPWARLPVGCTTWTPKERGRIKPRTSRKHLCAPRDADQNKSPLRIQDRYAVARSRSQ